MGLVAPPGFGGREEAYNHCNLILFLTINLTLGRNTLGMVSATVDLIEKRSHPLARASESPFDRGSFLECIQCTASIPTIVLSFVTRN